MPAIHGRLPSAATDRLRRENTATVLRSLRDGGPATRAALAQRTGLAKATIGAIAADLAAVGAVAESQVQTTGQARRIGRPGTPLSLDGARTVALGLEVNVDYLAATALDLSGRPVLRTTVPAPTSTMGLDVLAALAHDSHAALKSSGRTLLGTSVAVPGQVDRARGRVIDAPNLDWHDADVVGVLSAALGGGVVGLDNDANCAVVGEVAFGAAQGMDDVLYVTGTVGLGVGVFVDGGVRRGAHGLAGEIGHAPLGNPARRCACGRFGCWETAAGLRALLRETGVDMDGAAGPAVDPVATAHRVAARCADDPQVRAGVLRVAHALAAGLVPLAAALDPAAVVLGGSFVALGEWILPVARSQLRRVCRSAVLLSELGLHAASTGGAAGVLGQVYAGTLALD